MIAHIEGRMHNWFHPVFPVRALAQFNIAPAMKISFHGAARTVTGSKHLLHLPDGKKVLLDCGMFQGLGRDTLQLNKAWGFEPSEVDIVILSHAHIDHVGLLPKLIKDGYTGDIWCTAATGDLAQLLMRDSARIQEADVRHINKRRRGESREEVEPLYTEADAEKAAGMFRFAEYNEPVEIAPGLELTYSDVGHLLGSAAVNLKISNEGETTRITFSGDVGRYRDVILRSPQTFPQADYILLESTYGNSLHDMPKPVADDILAYIEQTCIQKKGKLVIPAFSVGRTQELLFVLNRLSLERRLPPLKYFVDSPLSIEATEVIKSHPECFNREVEQLLKIDDDVFAFEGLTYIRTAEESMALEERDEPCVIISSSGMAEAGRVKHHIAHTIGNPKNTILIVGYCDARSLGGKLKAGEKEVRIFGDSFSVEAEVGVISSLSAHGDYNDLLQWLSGQQPSEVKQIFLVHGEYEVQQAFRERLMRKGFEHVTIPDQHESIELRVGG